MRMKISSKIMNSKMNFSTVHSSGLLLEITESDVVIACQKNHPDGKSFCVSRGCRNAVTGKQS